MNKLESFLKRVAVMDATQLAKQASEIRLAMAEFQDDFDTVGAEHCYRLLEAVETIANLKYAGRWRNAATASAIDHINGNRYNNDLSNLRIVSIAEHR